MICDPEKQNSQGETVTVCFIFLTIISVDSPVVKLFLTNFGCKTFLLLFHMESGIVFFMYIKKSKNAPRQFLRLSERVFIYMTDFLPVSCAAVTILIDFENLIEEI